MAEYTVILGVNMASIAQAIISDNIIHIPKSGVSLFRLSKGSFGIELSYSD